MLIYSLPKKLPHEKIIKIIRRDVFILFKKVVLTAILIVLPALAFWLVINLYPGLWEGEISYALLLLAISAYALFIWLFSFFSFIDYYLDVWLITSERIIDVRQEGFFSRIVSELKIVKIQDVTSEQHGLFQFMFQYGYLHVQTAGEMERFIFKEIPHPERVRDIIIKLAEDKRHEPHHV